MLSDKSRALERLALCGMLAELTRTSRDSLDEAAGNASRVVMCACWVAQVMEEGERLSKKQLAQENTIKKLRAELAEARSDKGSTSASLAAERQKACRVRLATCCMRRTQDSQTSLQGTLSWIGDAAHKLHCHNKAQ